MGNKENPNETLSSTDKGDDIQRRFRYQCTYAAIISLYMFTENSVIEEVYCELHEDILVKLKTGKFGGIQVKTREIHLGPLELNDPEVKKSIRRFIQHECTFPDKFEHYTIATNVGFSKEKNKSLPNLIELAEAGKREELLKLRSKSRTWIQSIARESKCDEGVVIAVLKKLRLYQEIASMEDIEGKVTQKLAEILKLQSETFGTLNAMSEALILKHINASSLENKSPLIEYFILCKDPDEEEEKTIINGKKINRDCVSSIVKKIKTEAITLFIKDSSGIPSHKTDTKKLEIKMDRGGISYENIQLARDQKYSFEMLTAEWLYKDHAEAQKKYDQVKLIVNNECAEAYDEAKVKDQLFGTDMLKNLRTRVKNRLNYEKQGSFFDCKNEHLLGMAGVLTEECKVWWSEKFEIK